MSNTRTVYIGTYSTRGSKGVYTCTLNTETGALTQVAAAQSSNPSFLALVPGHSLVVVGNEWGDKSGVSIYKIGTNGALTYVNHQPIKDQGACHLAVSPDKRFVVASCYGNGAHAVLPIDEDGSLGAMSWYGINQGTLGPNKQRQEGPHAHSATFSPDGKFVYACDLGLDSVICYALDSKSGTLKVASVAKAASGAGCRHFAIHPKLAVCAVINELDSTITVFDRHAATGALTTKQTISTLPAPHAGNSCADLHYSADGRFLYGSNRGHNSIACFAVDGSSGRLTAIGHVSTGGKTPRNFGLVPGTNLLLAANQESDTVVSFKVGADGIPTPTGAVLSVPAPVCVVASPA